MIIKNITSRTFLYLGVIIIVANALFFDFNFFLTILGLLFVLFSTTISNLVNKYLKDK
ncbi:hypothetical protein IGI57_001502 [Enterococcus sp. DIV0213j]|jgi:hypothetical protein